MSDEIRADRALVAAYNAVEAYHWYVFPIQPNGKKPLLPWRAQSSNLSKQIEKWSTQFPNCNWGLDCGKSNILVLDVDCKNGSNGKESLLHLELEAMKLIHTFTVATPNGGLHYYYAGKRASRNAFRPGLDVKSDGGYVVLHGSKLDKGAYTILDDVKMAPTPSWLTGFLRDEQLPKHPKADSWLTEPDQEQNVKWAIDWLEHKAPECVQGQHGDDTLVKKVFFTLRDAGISEAKAILLVANHYNETKSFPPWTPEEIAGKAANAYRYAALPAGAKTPEGQKALAVEAFTGKPIDVELFSFKDLVIESVKKRDWVLGRRLLRRYLTGTVAPGGVGKSTLAFFEAIAVATGRAITGDVVFTTGPVVLYNAEDPLEELQMRLAATALFHGFKPSEFNSRKYAPIYLISGRDQKLRVAGLAPGNVYSARENDVSAIRDIVRSTRAVLFCGDPFVRLHDCPENDNIAIDKVAEIFTDLADELNIAIHLVHHTRKRSSEGGEGDADTARGASSFVNAMRLVHTLSVMDEKSAKAYGFNDEERKWYVRLDDAKINLAPPRDKVRWYKRVSVDLANGEAVGTLQSVDLEPVKRKNLAPPGAEHLEDIYKALLFCINNEDTPLREIIRGMQDTLEDKRAATAIYACLKRLLHAPVDIGNQRVRIVDHGTGTQRICLRVELIDFTLGKAVSDVLDFAD